MLQNFNVAIPTVFNSDESLNPVATLDIISYLYQQGVDSIVVCGSTGEQHSLSLQEKILLVNTINSTQSSNQLDILFGIASIRQKEAIQLASVIASSTAISTIMLGFPPYIRPTQKEAIHYAISIIETAKKPVLLYNNPLRTGFDLSVDSIKLLSEHHLVAGIKEAGEINKIEVLRKVINKPFNYFIGGETDILKKLAAGYNSISSVIGNLYPNEVKAILNAHLSNDNIKLNQSYLNLERSLTPFLQGNLLFNIKQELTKRGINAGICRLPLGG